MQKRDGFGRFAKGSIPSNASIRKNKTYEELYGKERSEEYKKKLRLAMKGVNLGRLSYRAGKTYGELYGTEKALLLKEKARERFTGEKNPCWIEDRAAINLRANNYFEVYTTAYVEWRTKVYRRDNYACCLADGNCTGDLEAHHIVPRRESKLLWYDVDNGITLCHAHHPRKYSDEKKLAPLFKKLIK